MYVLKPNTYMYINTYRYIHIYIYVFGYIYMYLVIYICIWLNIHIYIIYIYLFEENMSCVQKSTFQIIRGNNLLTNVYCENALENSVLFLLLLFYLQEIEVHCESRLLDSRNTESRGVINKLIFAINLLFITSYASADSDDESQLNWGN